MPDERVGLLVKVLLTCPGLHTISTCGRHKKTECLLSPVPNGEFYVNFVCFENYSDKIIPIIKRVIIPYSNKVTLERNTEAEEMLKDSLDTGDTVWDLYGTGIHPNMIAYNLLSELNANGNTD